VMVNQIEEFSSKIDNSGCEEKVCMEIYQYLRQWLLNHITHTDKELGKYLISKGVK
jgi:hemerythrin